MQRKMRHSKFKNTGILFELLSRQITADILAGKNTSSAKDLLDKYFRENTELGKEWQLYRFLLTEKSSDESKSDRIISVVLNQRSKLSNKRLAEEKYNLIKEIKELYPIEELLKAKIYNYKILASVFKLFEDCSSARSKFEVKEICQAKECLVEHLVNKSKPTSSYEEDVLEEYNQQPQEVRLLSYKFLVEGFNEKYNELDEDQKEVVREYITNIANTNSLGELISSKVKFIKSQLSEASEKINDNDVVKIKIEEIVNQLDKITPSKSIKDSYITAILLGFELLREVKNIIATK